MTGYAARSLFNYQGFIVARHVPNLNSISDANTGRTAFFSPVIGCTILVWISRKDNLMYMRRIVSGVFALSLMTLSSSYCRADEQKNSAPTPPAANAASEPGPSKMTDGDKKTANARAPQDEDAKLREHTEKFRQQYKDNPYTEKRTAAAEQLAKSLTENQVQAFAQIRDGEGILRLVRVTTDEIGTAVAACEKNNPDLKNSMSERFGSWKKDVDAALDKNDKAMDTDIRSGMAGDPKQVQSFLKLSDQWNAYNESKIEKKPVTTEGACKTLLSTMDKSGPAIVTQLESIKWPEPTPGKAMDGSAKTHDKAGAKQPDQTEPAAGKTR